MEYLQQYNPQITQMGQQSQEGQQNSSGFSLRRSRSVELRAGKLYPTCDCIKRNGLQNECRRTECQGQSCCSTRAGPTCKPANFAKRLANYSMGSSSGHRSRGTIREVKIQKLQEPNVPKPTEVPLANTTPLGTEEYTELKDLDPKLLGQIFPNGIPSSVPYTQFNGTPMMNQPIQAYSQNYCALPVSQTMMNAPQMISSTTSGDQAKGSELSSSSQQMMAGQPIISGMPQSFGTSPAPISSIEPVPTLHPLSSNNTFSSGVPVLQNGQPYGIPAQSFTPFTGGMNSYNPYSPNLASYLPCPGGIPAMTSGIPCGTAQ